MYKYIDRNGILFKKMVSIGVTFSDYEFKKENNFKQAIKIELPFDLKQEEQIELVLDYIFDLKSYRVDDVNDLVALKSLNNLPFILALNEHSNPKLYATFKRIPSSLMIKGDQEYKTMVTK
jgi:hypothetical protein